MQTLTPEGVDPTTSVSVNLLVVIATLLPLTAIFGQVAIRLTDSAEGNRSSVFSSLKYAIVVLALSGFTLTSQFTLSEDVFVRIGAILLAAAFLIFSGLSFLLYPQGNVVANAFDRIVQRTEDAVIESQQGPVNELTENQKNESCEPEIEEEQK